jgi:hypothetical protein
MDDRVDVGARFLSQLWFSTAEKVVATAIRVYGLDAAQAAALKKLYLGGNRFTVRPT